jgi:hypothetical protein
MNQRTDQRPAQRTSPRERYAAGQTLRAILDGLEPTGSQQDTRVREAVAVAARALERGRDPLDAVHQHYVRT